MFVNFKSIEYYSFRVKNAIYLPQKPDLKNETVMKKSESAYILSSENHIKQGVNKVNNFDKKKISKSWVESIIYLNVWISCELIGNSNFYNLNLQIHI